MGIELVAFDGDDTLWHNETIFSMTQERFEALLDDHAPSDVVHARTLDTERANLALYGYGIKSFTLSMIETAVATADCHARGSGIDSPIRSRGDDISMSCSSARSQLRARSKRSAKRAMTSACSSPPLT